MNRLNDEPSVMNRPGDESSGNETSGDEPSGDETSTYQIIKKNTEMNIMTEILQCKNCKFLWKSFR